MTTTINSWNSVDGGTRHDVATNYPVCNGCDCVATCSKVKNKECLPKVQPPTAQPAVSDAEILALNKSDQFFSESPPKFPEFGHGTQYHAGAPGVIGFARAVLALQAPTPQPQQSTPTVPPMPEFTDKQIRAGWEATFSTNNPFCPCDLKSFTKAVQWRERAAWPKGTV